ncbi:MAG TPA: NifB/NifX family molybdenum-iron cluster-binding protein [Tenuifilaceae bacterium]|jgi:predicted Fe-Mo cluster-binding NifX family protein|nr:dinitrogenase iron-molybdenum cofactor biosynthesis protein [Bacteroidales bacterium]HOC36170.1 NifB/NifX family molybdenum-iron cluster-binding protein [Tenuifilaceae bacterium]HOY72516.1 NifB/NifX family molybdenum-iron cluster-binding protein [Tenuifilaceae bacterium]HPA67232.1 NifB/NifX family molybdenum-iron cluster-binding protein [Tenuifilaceae bacterium]HPH00915.1 NifB/NifX family molybdenum-iron cluster-binding protein [Tenuifilaceae bacterium]
MRIAFTSTGKSWDSIIDSRFGRTEYIVIFDEETKTLELVDNSAVKNEAHGAGTATAQKMYEVKPDVLITGNGPGETAATALKRLNMKIYVDAHNLTLEQAYESYRNGALKEI